MEAAAEEAELELEATRGGGPTVSLSMRLLRRRRGAVALALALRGATRIQSNPLGAASSPAKMSRPLVKSCKGMDTGSGLGWGLGARLCLLPRHISETINTSRSVEMS